MRSVVLLAVVALLLCSSAVVNAATSCGNNGFCQSNANSCDSNSQQVSCEICCQPPTCYSGEETGSCLASTATCSSGRTAAGACSGSLQCCLPAAATVSCQSGSAFGTCQSTCGSGTTAAISGCADATLSCCVPTSTTGATCSAQGQVGVCQATTTTCSSGNTVSGFCNDATQTCCLPQAASTPVAQSCSAQGQTGTCQDPTTTCASSNSVQNVCSGTQVCCLPAAAPVASPCAAQGMAGTCQDSTACSANGGYPTPGLCPGSSSNQCCLPKPLNFGACTSPDGFVGVCTSTCSGGTAYSSDLCPGNSNVQCCVTNFAPSTPPPTPDYGKCAVNGVAGTCKSVSSCSGTPTAGLCGGPNDIQCCPDTGVAPTPVYAPTQPSGFYGACQASAGPGSCKDTSATCSAGSYQSGLCPASKGCCPDGGPASVAGVDLPGGVGYEVSEKTGFTSSVASCLATTGSSGGNAKYVLVRGWASTCVRDTQLSANLKTASTAGLTADVLMQPAAWCGISPKAQANSLIGAIGTSTFGRVWIKIDPATTASNWHPTNLNQNLRWVVEAASTLTAAYGTAKVGIASSASAWNKYMGTDATLLAKLNTLPLYYVGDSNSNFADFTSFGGWNYGYLKQTSASTTVCGVSVPATWLPTISATAAAAGTAPPAETNGPSCTVNGVSGFCKSVAGCSGSTVMGVCADSTQACCLSSAPQRPPLPGPNAVTVTLGQCTNNGQTGICRPSADCDPSDTQVTTSDCAADPSTNDQNVKCCIPQTAIVPPPNDDPSTAPPPYTPYPTQEHAGVSKVADAIPVVHTSKATAAAGGTNVNANVCVNKAGLALIESFEGFYANFYNDAVGIKTIGFGTACHAYPCDTLKPPLTRAQAEMVLLADMTAHYAPCVRNWVKVALNSNQFSALVSFVYNAGCGALQGSVGTQLNAGCYKCVRANLAKWNKAGGNVLAGLTRRRSAEADLFENPTVAGCLATAPTAPPAQGGQSWGTCSFQGKSGDCIDVSDCETTSVGGLCTGPSTVKCCLDAASNPPAPPANSCGNGGTCKASSSCNTGTNIIRSGLCAGDATITCCQPKSASAADGWWDGATRDALPAGSSWVTTYGGITVKPKIVLHTTEGGSYSGARSAYSGTHPHFTVTFEKGMFQAYQHVSILVSAKALKHPYGGVETNRAKAIQIEIVGTATKASTFDQRYLDGIKTLMRWIEGVYGIPKRGATFLAYPASAGNSKVRMSDNDWLAFSGTCGHQHVPDNDHGDPGNININYLLSGAGTVYPATASKIAIINTPGLSGLPGDFGKCTSAGLTGVCQDSALCGGTVIAGLCTGPAGVACCMENFGSCAAPQGQGICKESSTCNGQKVSGLCPGPSSVTCCVPEVGTCSVGTQTGKCQATSTCTGTVVAGLCTGPSSVSCCLPAKPATNYGTCAVSYTNSTVTGSCIPKANCAAPMTSTPGLCPGDSSIGCCHNPAPVRTFTACGVGGTCRDVADCTGTVKSGLCDGPANIKCCENPAKPKASLAAPLNIPRGLLSAPVNNGSSFAPAAPTWTAAQLTLCSAGGLQGFCMDGSVGNAVCNGVVTYPSSCASPSMCCTPQPCALNNVTSGICIPPTECTNQAGYVTPGYCGVNGGADGTTSCCTGAGVAQCDTEGLLACLLADGDATTCAVSFNCPPLPDYTGLNSAVQTAPLAGPVAHQMDSPDTSSSTGTDNGGNPSLSAASSIAPYTLASFVMAFAAMIAAMLY